MKSLSNLLTVIAASLLLHACKKAESPMVETKPDYGNSPISGKWKVTYEGADDYYVPMTPYGPGEPHFSHIDLVTINSTTKQATFSINKEVQPPQSYVYTTVGDSIFITLDKDVFYRSKNYKIWVSKHSDSTMTWVAIDPKLSYYPGPYGFPPPPATFTAEILEFSKQ
jgi:hypothetical protein